LKGVITPGDRSLLERRPRAPGKRAYVDATNLEGKEAKEGREGEARREDCSSKPARRVKGTRSRSTWWEEEEEERKA